MMNSLNDFAQILIQCNSQDDEIRRHSESVRDSFLNEQTSLFLEWIIQIILNDEYSNLHEYAILVIYSVYRHQKQILTPEITQRFYQDFRPIFPQLLSLNSITDLQKSWISYVLAFVMAHLHQQFPDFDFNFNESISDLEKSISINFLFTIITEAIECSHDLCTFDLNFLFQLIQSNPTRLFDIVNLYFSIIAKSEPINEFLEIFPQILEIIDKSTEYQYLSIISNFCEKNSSYLSAIVLDLSKFISNKAINSTDEQTILQCLFIFENIAQYNTDVICFSVEFFDILIDTFVSVLNRLNYMDDEDSLSSICPDIVYQITQSSLPGLTSRLVQRAETFLQGDLSEYIYGFLVFFASNADTLDIKKIIDESFTDLLQNDDVRIKYIAYKILNHSKSIIRADVNYSEILEIIFNDISADSNYKIVTLALKVLYYIIEMNYPIIKNNVEEFQQKLLESFSFVDNEECLAALIRTLTKLQNKISKIPEIQPIFELFNNILKECDESDVVKIEILNSGISVLKTILDNVEKAKKGEVKEELEKYAKILFNLCVENLNRDESEIDPKFMKQYHESMLTILSYIQDTGEYGNDLWIRAFNVILKPIHFKEFSRNEYIDLTVFTVIDKIQGNTKYAIENTIVDLYTENINIINYMCCNQTYFDKLLDHNNELLNSYLEILNNFITTEYFITNIAVGCFVSLISLFKYAYDADYKDLADRFLQIFSDGLSQQKYNEYSYAKLSIMFDCIQKIMTTQNLDLNQYPVLKESILKFTIKSLQYQLEKAIEYYQSGQNMMPENDFISDQFTGIEMFVNPLIQMIKIDHETLKNLFGEHILPILLNAAENEIMIQIYPTLLLIYTACEPDGTLFGEYHDIFYNLLNVRIENADSPEALKYISAIDNFMMFFFNLFGIIHFPQNYILELLNYLKEAVDGDYFSYLKKYTNVCNVIAGIYFYYPEIYSDNFENELLFIINPQFSPCVRIDDNDNYYILTLLIASWIYNYGDYLDQQAQQADASDEYSYYYQLFSLIFYDGAYIYDSLTLPHEDALKRLIIVVWRREIAHRKFVQFMQTYENDDPDLIHGLNENITRIINEFNQQAINNTNGQ